MISRYVARIVSAENRRLLDDNATLRGRVVDLQLANCALSARLDAANECLAEYEAEEAA